MPPEDNSPELEALILQNKEHNEIVQDLLEALVVQGDQNKPDPKTIQLLEKLVEASENTQRVNVTLNLV